MKPGLDLESSDKLGLYQSNDLTKLLPLWYGKAGLDIQHFCRLGLFEKELRSKL